MAAVEIAVVATKVMAAKHSAGATSFGMMASSGSMETTRS
jgi:hypothetical protein